MTFKVLQIRDYVIIIINLKMKMIINIYFYSHNLINFIIYMTGQMLLLTPMLILDKERDLSY